MIGLAVEEPAALVVRGDQLDVLGEGSAHVFLKSHDKRQINWHELNPGESAELIRDARGNVVLRRPELASSKR